MGRFGKLEKIKDMTCHTLKVTKNQKIFYEIKVSAMMIGERKVTVETFEPSEIAKEIQKLAIEVYSDSFEANEVNVEKGEPWPKRDGLQKQAAAKCRAMLPLIDVAAKYHHVKARKVEYWARLVRNTREEILSWNLSDRKRYEGKTNI